MRLYPGVIRVRVLGEGKELTILFIVLSRNMLYRVFYPVFRDIVLVTYILQERQCLWTERVAVLSKDLCIEVARQLVLLNENAWVEDGTLMIARCRGSAMSFAT